MKIRYAPLAVACALMVAATAQAAAVTYSFGGTLGLVVDLPPLSVGDTFTGSFTYETTAVDAEPDPSIGFYPNGFSINVTVNGHSFSSSTASVLDCPTCGGISLLDGPIPSSSDYFIASNSRFGAAVPTSAPVIGPQIDGIMPFELSVDLGGPVTLYDSDALPPTLALSSFSADRTLNFRFSNNGGQNNAIARGNITSLTLITAPPIPEPSTTAMLALGLGALALVRRRKDR